MHKNLKLFRNTLKMRKLGPPALSMSRFGFSDTISPGAPAEGEKYELYESRNELENKLKIAVSKLSRATTANELVKMLQVAAYAERQDVCHQTLKYLIQAQKVSHLENSELADLFASLVLVRFHGLDAQDLAKFMKTIEYLLLRRVHSMESSDLCKIVFSYAQLVRQRKVSWASTNVFKTLEYMIQNTWNEQRSMNDQARVLNSFFEMAETQIKMDSGTGSEKNRAYINNILQLTDAFLVQMEERLEGEEGLDLSDSQLIALLYHLRCQIEGSKYGIHDISEELDVHILSDELTKRQKDPNFTGDLKVKSFFDILAIQVKCGQKLDFHNIISEFL